MELIKKNIHMNHRKNQIVSQLTLDDDFNVSDTKPDIVSVIQEKGNVRIEDVKASNEHVTVKGALDFAVLYFSNGEEQVQSLTGSIPFEETLNMPDLDEKDRVRIRWELEDLTISLINSRKISVQAIITLTAFAEELYDEETTVEAHDERAIQSKTRDIQVLQLAVQKKDTCRIKEDIVLSSDKPNIFELLWDSVQIRNMDIKMMDQKIALTGELLVFVMYMGEDEEHRLQWTEVSLPFDGMIECGGCREGIADQVQVAIAQKELEVKPDYDGEERLIHVDVVLELDINLYEEEEFSILDDVYVPGMECKTIKKDADYHSLMARNFSKCRAADRIRLTDNQSRILQICHGEGQVAIDQVEIQEDGILIEGAVNVQLLYISSDDNRPFDLVKGSIPFSHKVDIQGMQPELVYSLRTDLESMSYTMIDSEEMEVKVTVNLNMLVLSNLRIPIIVDVQMSELDMEKIQQLPGIVGYVVQKEDSLWDIAKKYYTTIENITELNELESSQIKPGDKLIIMKQVEQAG